MYIVTVEATAGTYRSVSSSMDEMMHSCSRSGVKDRTDLIVDPTWSGEPHNGVHCPSFGSKCCSQSLATMTLLPPALVPQKHPPPIQQYLSSSTSMTHSRGVFFVDGISSERWKMSMWLGMGISLPLIAINNVDFPGEEVRLRGRGGREGGREGWLTRRGQVQDVRLTTTIEAHQPVPATTVQLNLRVIQKLHPVEGERELVNVDIAGGRVRGEYT